MGVCGAVAQCGLQLMERVVVYAILSDGEVLSSWTHPRWRAKRSAVERVVSTVGGGLLVRRAQCGELWTYSFSQDEYTFVLAAAAGDRQLRMQNYLKVIADLFYELYDERKFPTVLDCLMNEINRIEASEGNEDELQRLTSSLHTHKLRLTSLLSKQQSHRTCKLAAALLLCIVLLAIYYFRSH